MLQKLDNRHYPFIFLDDGGDAYNYKISRNFNASNVITSSISPTTLKSILDNIEEGTYHMYSSNVIMGRYLFLKKSSTFYKIDVADIDYLHSEGNYTNLYTNGEKYTIKYSLTRLLEIPNFDAILRVHRNYAVQKNEISEVSFSKRVLKSRGREVPFGRTYTKNIRRWMNIPS